MYCRVSVSVFKQHYLPHKYYNPWDNSNKSMHLLCYEFIKAFDNNMENGGMSNMNLEEFFSKYASHLFKFLVHCNKIPSFPLFLSDLISYYANNPFPFL